MSEFDDIDDEIQKEIEREKKRSKELKKKEKEPEQLSPEERKIRKLREEKERLKAVMAQRRGEEAPDKGKSPKKAKRKKRKRKKKKKSVVDDISKKEEFMAELQNRFSAENIKEVLGEIFSVDNILKYKWIIVLVTMLVVPTILFFSTAGIRANQLTRQQAPELETLDYWSGEEYFTLQLYNPMARDRATDEYRTADFTISFVKDPDTNYILEDSEYNITVHNVNATIWFKSQTDSGWGDAKFEQSFSFEQTLGFGESVTGEINITNSIFDDNSPDSDSWTNYTIQIAANVTEYYAPDDPTIVSVNYIGSIVDVDLLRGQNMPAANRYALIVTIAYLVIMGVTMLFFMIWLRKKKYSFIKPF